MRPLLQLLKARSFPRSPMPQYKMASLIAAATVAQMVKSDDSHFFAPSNQSELATANVRQRTEKNMKSNKSFLKDRPQEELIEEYTSKFSDVKRREILRYIPQIIDGISGRHGLHNQVVVEVGCGTGIFVEPLSKAVGPDGVYLGLDISPGFLYHVQQEYGHLDNVKFHLCEADDLKLPENLRKKVDVFYLCATYHHLADPRSVLQEIYKYLKPGGKLIVVEFKKHGHHGHHHHKKEVEKAPHPGKHSLNTEWIKGHLSFTEQEARNEITANGFIFERGLALRILDLLHSRWQPQIVYVPPT